MKNESILKYITDLPNFIKNLFEEGLQLSLAEAQKNWECLYPFSTPCPTAYWGQSDWRTTDNRLFEKSCLAKIRLAHALSLKDRNNIPFYDLICITLSKYGSLEEKKYYINEILKFTSSETIRDHYAEELCKINKTIKEYGYTNDALPFIIGLDKFLKDDGKYFDLFRCSIHINQHDLSKVTDGEMIELVAEEEPYWNGYPDYPIHKATLRFHNVTKFNYNPSQLLGGIVVRKNELQTGLEIKGHALRWDSDVFQIECEKIEIVDYSTCMEKNPCDGYSSVMTTIINDTPSVLKIKLYDPSYSNFELGSDVKLPKENNPYIIIPPNRSIGIITEVDENKLQDYISNNYNPLNMIEEFIINNLSVKPEIIYSSIKYDIKERPAGCFKYSNGVEFIFVISNM